LPVPAAFGVKLQGTKSGMDNRSTVRGNLAHNLSQRNKVGFDVADTDGKAVMAIICLLYHLH
jgi:hypothetical protein